MTTREDRLGRRVMMVHYAKFKEEWMALLEICCYSVECAATAQQRG